MEREREMEIMRGRDGDSNRERYGDTERKTEKKR